MQLSRPISIPVSGLVLGTLLAAISSGCGQNAHVLGPGGAGSRPSSPTDAPPNGGPPGTSTGTPPGAETPPGSLPPVAVYPPGSGKPPVKPPGGNQQSCPEGPRVSHFAGRALSVGERRDFTGSDSGFAMDLQMPLRTNVLAFNQVWLLLDGPSMPARGSTGDALCLVEAGVCASMESQDARRINLMELFPTLDWGVVLYSGITIRWRMPASWNASHATLQVEMNESGCTASLAEVLE